ncbi:class IIb bacteriocin, lactobin A/cerein 7B family [Streptococcus suis]|uniref:class IIb bacteriocin, lactobin A/cerein 7B family n=1 Tax=Streptococcus suis TaxID=1307 RepID=UPI000426598B|nr:class IIb bacteriocin, lactobin A/cerein 7B family [Streptococcus suis]NQM49657.1 class IIb bacteriocin, lactobin A/cerein 7B family [Streptococcus suis]UUM58869.1 class IIb bacteriocin, lactobin A/cerein 7B family [Streptococcus suis]UUM63098.1 class IIb bacteriocin, lactobin A/cerein 7B family [Streptococcus suis]HEL1551517.1 class IIb bacteriocin, lactobin A/cerein 7B family [Streptococcus suis]HEM2781076.1 class IIb bacteriocin, lactobin A/cerein 7B family [Streptococcus suis]
MENIKKFEEVSTEELTSVEGGVGVLEVIGWSLLAAGGSGLVGYGLARTFG